VARAAPEWRSSRIAHRNGVRTLTVHALQDQHTLASQVLKRAMPEIESLPLPPGYRIEYGGERESQRETFGEMRVALLLSLVLIFLILLFQFRSPLQTLLIMMSIPFALPGAVLGLVLTGNPFSFTAFMGVISLSGIVVRNAIILVEYINERRRAGVEVEQAAREAGERRLRPIFLTTAAAAVGVTPMIASGSSLWSPLASVIAVGLLVSMFFTLVLVPVLYAAGARLRGGAGPAAAAALVALALAPASQAQEVRKLTLEEAQSMALGGNSWIKLARLKAKESERRAAGARSHYFPQISSESSVFYAGGLQSISLPRGALGVFPQLGPLPASDLTVLQGRNDYVLAMQSFGQPLTQLVRIRAGARAASEDAAIAGSEARRVEDEIRLKVTEAFLGVLVSERRSRAAQLESEAAEEALREARDAVSSGAALEVKVLEAEARRLELSNAHLAARIAESDVRAELNDLLGLPQEARLELVPPGSPPPEPAPLAALLEEASARNPEVEAARHTVEKARQGLKAARAEHIPDLTFFTQHIYQNGVPFLPRNNATVGARLTVNLFDGGRRAAAAGERQAQLEQAEENLRRLKNRLALDIGKIHRKAERLAGLRAVAEKALELRLEARRIVADQVEAGLATAAALKRAEAAAAQAEAQRFEAEAALRIALAELARAAGAR
jgi:outer membrane protein TolC